MYPYCATNKHKKTFKALKISSLRIFAFPLPIYISFCFFRLFLFSFPIKKPFEGTKPLERQKNRSVILLPLILLNHGPHLIKVKHLSDLDPFGLILSIGRDQ